MAKIVVIGAVQGASCFGFAYDYALTFVTDLRKRKIRIGSSEPGYERMLMKLAGVQRLQDKT